jgi:hypothetical protein
LNCFKKRHISKCPLRGSLRFAVSKTNRVSIQHLKLNIELRRLNGLKKKAYTSKYQLIDNFY